MLILQPTSGEKTITIAPRTVFNNSFKGRVLSDSGVYEESTCLILFQSEGYSMKLRRDGDGKEETIVGLSVNGITNFTNVTFNPTILEEDSTYYLEITKDGGLWYRDKIYATSQTAQQRITEKKEIGNGTIYKAYSPVDDNTYII
tara:strand:- start:849 stop:1283 length:435 start_codon:yes stop_codon:yes gene_type:complete